MVSVKRLAIFGTSIVILIIGAIGWSYYKIAASLPDLDGEIKLSGLRLPVKVDFDEFAVPTINAQSRQDAYTALGFLLASERLFQMDLMRRKSGGRLAEIFGTAAVETDISQRYLGLEATAQSILMHIPDDQKQILDAFAKGVNDYLGRSANLSFEFLLLGYRPESWSPRDSILVALAMFQDLNWNDRDERMLSVMENSLPAKVVAFLTPDSDEYSKPLIGGVGSHRPMRPIPVEALAMLRGGQPYVEQTNLVQPDNLVLGSNNWAVSGRRTADGRAILANDMHLPIGVPNIWYRARLRFADVDIAGVVLPGVPMIVAGSNRRVAWGYTNLYADLVDLVVLDIDPENPDLYRVNNSWKPFETSRETIRVKQAQDVTLEVKRTIWGPVAHKPLMGNPVAIRWTALDPTAVNLGLMDMEYAKTLEQALDVMNRAGGPPQNVVLADDRGRIAWTIMGRLPRRSGFDGSVSRSWSDGAAGWRGYIDAAELPRRVDPPAGFLMSANNRTVGTQYPHVIGHNFPSGYRAYRIAERLGDMNEVTERDLFELQLDTVTEFFEFYRKLAMSVVTSNGASKRPDLDNARQVIAAWNGRADVDSKGLALLSEFRQRLAKTVITPYLTNCRRLDDSFVYRWLKLDPPIKRLLTEKIPKTLPNPKKYSNWDTLILAVLEDAIDSTLENQAINKISELNWGRFNRAEISHPFSRAMPWLAGFLDMSRDELAGCRFCVRVATRRFGASQRMVVSPGAPDDAIMQMPAGQSGHPLSEHFNDQHKYWVQGRATAFISSNTKQTLKLLPRQALNLRQRGE